MRWRSVIAMGSLALLAGCTNYYAVQDSSGATYYTRHITEYKDGSVSFVDAKSARDMTVGAPTVTRITEQEYNDSWRTQPVYGNKTEYTATPAGGYISPTDQPYVAGPTTRPSDERYRTTGIPTTPAPYDQSFRQSTRENANQSLLPPEH